MNLDVPAIQRRKPAAYRAISLRVFVRALSRGARVKPFGAPAGAVTGLGTIPGPDLLLGFDGQRKPPAAPAAGGARSRA